MDLRIKQTTVRRRRSSPLPLKGRCASRPRMASPNMTGKLVSSPRGTASEEYRTQCNIASMSCTSVRHYKLLIIASSTYLPGRVSLNELADFTRQIRQHLITKDIVPVQSASPLIVKAGPGGTRTYAPTITSPASRRQLSNDSLSSLPRPPIGPSLSPSPGHLTFLRVTETSSRKNDFAISQFGSES